MKKVLIIVSIIIVVIIATLIAIPVFFKGEILQIIQNQSSRYIKAELKIGDVNLSMFKNFPNLNVALKDVTITGEKEFAGDTVMNIPLFEASVNLKSLIAGDELIVNRILLKNCRLQPSVDTAGRANWDILIGGEATPVPDSAPASETNASPKEKKDEKGLRLNDIAIENLYVSYNDYQTSTYASIGSIDLQLAGNFSESNTVIHIVLALNDISYRQHNSI